MQQISKTAERRLVPQAPAATPLRGGGHPTFHRWYERELGRGMNRARRAGHSHSSSLKSALAWQGFAGTPRPV